MHIRTVTLDDAHAICNIYNYYIKHTAVSFETLPVSESVIKQRINEITNAGFPIFVGEVNGKVIGYCCVHQWNSRSAYDSTVEESIYLDQNEIGKGYGSVLLQHLLDHLDKSKIHVVIAGICIPNEGSVRLHEKFGFKQVSHMKEIGRKFDEWRDVGHWQLTFDK